MIFKSYVLEKNIQLLNKNNINLFYGENQGLKKDFKENIKKDNVNLEIINLVQDDIIKNKKILINEISNQSLFNKKKIILIDEVNDKIFKFLEDVLNYIGDERQLEK